MYWPRIKQPEEEKIGPLQNSCFTCIHIDDSYCSKNKTKQYKTKTNKQKTNKRKKKIKKIKKTSL
jgi:hypothetical protein